MLPLSSLNPAGCVTQEQTGTQEVLVDTCKVLGGPSDTSIMKKSIMGVFTHWH